MKTESAKRRKRESHDVVLEEVWRAKDALSAARGHSVEKLFADLREREKHSGHPVVNLQAEPKNSPKAK